MNLKQWMASFVIILITFACASKKEEAQEEGNTPESKEWKEMDEFHMLMAETFHPYKDSANLEPAKMQARELATAAEKWSSSPLPEKVNNDEMKAKLEELKNGTSALVQSVGSGDNKAIGEQLTKVHDLFHDIQEDWYGGTHEHH
jgi:hypothetical protein